MTAPTVPALSSGVKLVFAHDTETALAAAAALVNTQRWPGTESLPDPETLAEFLDHWGWSGARQGDLDELEQVRNLRPVLRRLWGLEESELAETVNRMLRDAGALPQLVRHDDWPYHLHATPSGAPLADRMAVEAAMAMVDVIRQDELARLRGCGAPDCGCVYVDLSRNQSRRYCSTTCSNRVNVAAYRNRRSGADE
jgi:predicted RNA-binding Zn ribbon-like protein